MPQPPNPRERVIGVRQIAGLAGLAGVFILALSAALAALKGNFNLLHTGRTDPGAGEAIGSMGFADHLALYLEPGRILSSDRITCIALIVVAGMALAFALALARDGARCHRRAVWMFLLMALGSAYLASDELLGIHVWVGDKLRRALDLPVGNRPDRLVLLAYAIPVLLFVRGFRQEIKRSRRAVGAMALAFALFLIGVVADLAGTPAEEAFELAGALSLVASVPLLGLNHFAQATAAPALRHEDNSTDPA